MQVYFDFEISKRGVTCSMCRTLIPTGETYFKHFNFDKSVMKFPIAKSLCKECSKNILSDDFLNYLKTLYIAIKSIKVRITKENIC